MIEPEPASQAAQPQEQASQQAAQAAQQVATEASESAAAETVGDALDPVLTWERNNVEFWVQIAQLVVLVLILQEVRG
jgi:hypothetical protein